VVSWDTDGFFLYPAQWKEVLGKTFFPRIFMPRELIDKRMFFIEKIRQREHRVNDKKWCGKELKVKS
jgi:hypothetical protein